MAFRIVLCTILLVAMSPQPEDDTLRLSLEREYGRARFHECRLEIGISGRQGKTQLTCAYNSQRPPALIRERSLTVAEVSAALDLSRRSNLCVAPHLGTDERAVDGALETLMTHCGGGRVAVLVTSGNATFAAIEPAGQLLALLHRLEADLRQLPAASK